MNVAITAKRLSHEGYNDHRVSAIDLGTYSLSQVAFRWGTSFNQPYATVSVLDPDKRDAYGSRCRLLDFEANFARPGVWHFWPTTTIVGHVSTMRRTDEATDDGYLPPEVEWEPGFYEVTLRLNEEG